MNDTKIFVGNVPFTCTYELFKDTLKTIEGFKNCDIIIDSIRNLCKGYGFVIFDTYENAERVIKRNDIIIENRVLRFVSYCKKKHKDSHIKNVPHILPILNKEQYIPYITKYSILISNIPCNITNRIYLKETFNSYELSRYFINTDKKTGLIKTTGVIELKNYEDYKKLLEESIIKDSNDNILKLTKYNQKF
jgi:hypothetical protein